MPSATTVPPHLELLTFLSDPNAKVREVALSNLVGYSAKTNPQRTLLIEKHKGLDGKPLQGRDGKDVDTIEDLKRICQDQPMAAHDAFCALINLSDSLLVARRIGDEEFLSFLVRYIADPVSLLTDLACMLLSNLTKLESIGAILLNLELPARPLYNFMSNKDFEATMEAMSAEPDDPEYAVKKQRAEQHSKRLAEMTAAQKDVPALSLLLDAFEEGADVAGEKSQSATIEEMRTRARQIQQGSEQNGEGSSEKVPLGPDGRPVIKRKSNCNFLASVFANVTTIPKGREFFVTRLQNSLLGAAAEAASKQKDETEKTITPPAREYPVARLMVYTEHPDLIRRGGVISTLKNLFFLKSCHKALLAPPTIDVSGTALAKVGEEALATANQLPPASRPEHLSSVDALPNLLLPLCDGKELAKLDLEDQEALPDECQLMDEEKKRERDPALRLMLIEGLLLLCTTLYGRQCLRGRGTYVVVREAHLDEKDEKVAEAVVRLVNILKRDESESSLRELEEEIGAEEVEQETSGNDLDDEDLMIEEL